MGKKKNPKGSKNPSQDSTPSQPTPTPSVEPQLSHDRGAQSSRGRGEGHSSRSGEPHLHDQSSRGTGRGQPGRHQEQSQPPPLMQLHLYQEQPIATYDQPSRGTASGKPVAHHQSSRGAGRGQSRQAYHPGQEQRQEESSSKQLKISPSEQQFPPMQQQLPPMQQQFSPMQQQLPPMQQQFPPMHQQFPPMQQQIPSQLEPKGNKRRGQKKERQAGAKETPSKPSEEGTPVATVSLPKEISEIIATPSIPIEQLKISPSEQQFPPKQQQIPPIQQQVPPKQQQTPPTQQQIPPTQQQIPSQPEPKGNKRRGQKKENKADAKETPSTSSKEGTPAATVSLPKEKSETIATPLKPTTTSTALDFITPRRLKLNSGGTKGRRIPIETNHLALMFKNLGTAIHYDVALDPDKPKKLLRFVMDEFRRKNYPNRYPAFDGAKNLYSSSMLPFGQEVSGEVTIKENDRDKIYKVSIKFAARVDLSVLSNYFQSACSGNIHMETPQRAIQCIDVVLRNAPSLRCIPVGRSYFTRPTDRTMELGEGMEMYYGFYQSAILGWKPFLNVDVSHKAFPKSISVLDLIQQITDRYDINTPLQYENYEVVNNFLRMLKVVYQIPNQPATRRVMGVNGLDKAASQARFLNENKVEMTVAHYFERVKNVRLRYPHLPCLWVGNRTREPRILLPPEFCTILEGQVTNRTMTAGQTSAMIKIAATSTADRKHKIMAGVKTANYASDSCAREFNISVNSEFTKITARVLDPPPLQYLDRQVRPSRGAWRAEKFSLTQKLTNWCIFCVDDRTRPQTLQEFAMNLIKESKMLGMDIDTPDIRPPLRLMRGREKAKLEEEFSKLKNKSLILVVIPDFIKETYFYVKQAAELTVGVVTQCVKAKNVYQKKPSTLSNILLKINAKLNGRNHQLVSTPKCLLRPCMIMGADVTHPSPEARGQLPSVAAVTASHDKFAFQYNITWRLQPSTKEIISDLANIVREHLMFFYRKNRAKPERIIFFRDGVSEGQFEDVVHTEVQAVRQACNMLETAGTYKPRVTFLVVQKRHHTRFFPLNPRDSEDRNMNVPAGTIVDTEITHPTALDFYLVSHASIQGVARPTKYRKLWDDDDMQEDELEELTYHLCHLFTRCTRSVSYPAPTYYAHLAAARAKVYCERRNINMNNLDREQAQLQIKEDITQQFPMFFV